MTRSKAIRAEAAKPTLAHGFFRSTLLHYALLALMLIWMALPQAQAQDDDAATQPASYDGPDYPHFRVLSDGKLVDGLPLLLTTVDVNIIGFVADVTVTQHYKNDGDVPLEAIYLFPGSVHGAVYAMSMDVGQRRIRGVVQEKQQARETYQQAISEGKTSSLLEQNEFKFFQTKVGNILPGDDIRVELRYTETLIADAGVYRFRFPMVRQGEEGATQARDSGVAGAVQQVTDLPFDLSLQVNAGMPLASIDSPSHPVDIKLEKNGAEVLLREEGIYQTSSDFVLEYRLAGERVQSGLLLYQDINTLGEAENYFLLMAQPPAQVREEDITPREYLFVVDVSGSMNGFPLDLAKKMAANLLGQLRPQDRFNVYLFSGGSEQFAPASVLAEQENIRQGVRFIDSSNAGGGTELLPVLESIQQSPQEDGVSRSVIVITDGGIAFGRDTIQFIDQHLNDMNLFSFGVGDWRSDEVLEAMAKAGRGQAFLFSQEDEDIKQRLDGFISYISQPVLADIRLEFPPGFDVYEQQPASIPDVFSQRPVYVVGKWRARPAGDLILRGYSGSNPYSAHFPIHSASAGEQNRVIRLLWARERLDQLVGAGYNRFEEETRDAIVALGLKYNLLTQETSFVAVDEVVRVEADQTLESSALQNAPEPRPAAPQAATYSGYGATPGLLSVNLNTRVVSQTPKLPYQVSQRLEMPLVADPTRPQVTFILGQDQSAENPFYAAASAYFQSQPEHPVVDHLRSLEEVRRWLEQHAPASGQWGVINLVTHATPWTGLAADIDADSATAADSPLDLGQSQATLNGLASIDRFSQFRVYGCGLGATPGLLQQLGRYFGGRRLPQVVSPRVPVVFQTAGLNAEGVLQAAQVAAWPSWWVLSPGSEPLSQARLVQALNRQYGERDWVALLQSSPGANVDRLLSQPIRVRVAIPDGAKLRGRVRPASLARKQAQLMAYLEQAQLDPAQLRWSLVQEDGEWLLQGQGWIQQVIGNPAEAETAEAPYILVSAR